MAKNTGVGIDTATECTTLAHTEWQSQPCTIGSPQQARSGMSETA